MKKISPSVLMGLALGGGALAVAGIAYAASKTTAGGAGTFTFQTGHRYQIDVKSSNGAVLQAPDLTAFSGVLATAYPGLFNVVQIARPNTSEFIVTLDVTGPTTPVAMSSTVFGPDVTTQVTDEGPSPGGAVGGTPTPPGTVIHPPLPPGGFTKAWRQVSEIFPGMQTRIAISPQIVQILTSQASASGTDVQNLVRAWGLVTAAAQVRVFGPGQTLPPDWPSDDPGSSYYHAEFTSSGTEPTARFPSTGFKSWGWS